MIQLLPMEIYLKNDILLNSTTLSNYSAIYISEYSIKRDWHIGKSKRSMSNKKKLYQRNSNVLDSDQ